MTLDSYRYEFDNGGRLVLDAIAAATHPLIAADLAARFYESCRGVGRRDLAARFLKQLHQETLDLP